LAIAIYLGEMCTQRCWVFMYSLSFARLWVVEIS
jgi:hypothetical protein